MTDQPTTLAAALVALQARLPRITKDTQGVHSKYANLAAIHDAVFPLTTELGLSWTCEPTISGDRFVLRYTLSHALSGENITGDYPLTESNPQTMGGQITYARRYALCSVLGIAPAEDDDDAQAAANDWRPPANPRSRKAERHNAARNGPLPDDQWTGPAPDSQEAGSITAGQRARLMAGFNRAGITDRKDRLAYAAHVLDLGELESSNNLSAAQAGELITRLEGEKP